MGLFSGFRSCRVAGKKSGNLVFGGSCSMILSPRKPLGLPIAFSLMIHCIDPIQSGMETNEPIPLLMPGLLAHQPGLCLLWIAEKPYGHWKLKPGFLSQFVETPLILERATHDRQFWDLPLEAEDAF